MPSFLLLVFGCVLAAPPHIIVTPPVDRIAQITADMTELGAVWMSDSSQSTPSGSRSVSPIRIVHVQNPLRVPPSPTYGDFSHFVPTEESENIPENEQNQLTEIIDLDPQELFEESVTTNSSNDTEPPPPIRLPLSMIIFLNFLGCIIVLSIAFSIPAALHSF